MLTDKEAKKKYRPEFYKNPEKYYATDVLKREGFHRAVCSSCAKPFWSVNARNVCGDPACGTVPFSFIGNTPAKKSLEYIGVWKKFSLMFKKFGYAPIQRYPIVARWNPTMEFTNASIAAFQPYVVSGEVEPPAKKLVIPQLCFRTVDIDNVGITGSHNTVFCMIGQHMFVQPKEWNQNEVFKHIYAWLRNGLALPKEEIIFHEDAWAGGGNLGPCMEFFSRGCELGNQVYMMYEQTENGIKELDLKVLDMGMGQERNAWFSQGCNTAYDAAFPTVISYLVKKTGLKFDSELHAKYVPYAGLLNLDEVDNIEAAWKRVAEKTGTEVGTLKKNILPLAGIYSVAEHSRALLVMFNDGALPSNMGDSYNLRIIVRRMLGFIDEYGWSIDAQKLFEFHAKYLKPQFPELSKNLEDVNEIFSVEKEKYEKSKEKSKSIISKIISREITTGDLLRLYDSGGIQPSVVAEEAGKMGKTVKVPENFYSLVAELHEKEEQKHATRKATEIDFGNVQKTEALYFDDYKKGACRARVLGVKDNFVVLDRTVAYPTSGGQMHDAGTINGEQFVEVFKQGALIVHKMEKDPAFRPGDEVNVKIDMGRRIQLAIHHTATHVVNEAARRVLGNHVNQASAFKDVDGAHLDVTHFAALTDEELGKIEKESNAITKKSLNIEKKFMKRNEAETSYGTRIYQGGVVPGKTLRIVNIAGTDVEACGGTHLDNTSEIGKIIVISAEHIQDNISRINFVAGPAAAYFEKEQKRILGEVEDVLGVKGADVIKAAERLFENWKKLKKRPDFTVRSEVDGIAKDLKKKIFDNVLVAEVEDAYLKKLQSLSKALSSDDRIIVLFGNADKIYVFASAGKNTSADAGKIVREAAQQLKGSGGGSKEVGQGVAFDKARLNEVIRSLEAKLRG